VIEEDGSVETSASKADPNNKEIVAKAIVQTVGESDNTSGKVRSGSSLPTGASITRFEYFDKSLNKIIKSQPTLKDGSIYEPGNEATIEESESGGLSLKVKTKVTKPIEFREGR
jgi:hypothetical protein